MTNWRQYDFCVVVGSGFYPAVFHGCPPVVEEEMKILRKNETKEFKNSDKFRRKIRAFFEKIIEFLEDWEDTRAARKALKYREKGKSLGVIAKELGLSKDLQ